MSFFMLMTPSDSTTAPPAGARVVYSRPGLHPFAILIPSSSTRERCLSHFNRLAFNGQSLVGHHITTSQHRCLPQSQSMTLAATMGRSHQGRRPNLPAWSRGSPGDGEFFSCTAGRHRH